MLHKLIDKSSGAEILSDDKWLPVYKSRKEIEYIGEVEEPAAVVAETPQPKSKKGK